TVDGIEVIPSAIAWRDSHAATAAAIAEAINSEDTEPNYTAFANGAKLIILAGEAGVAYDELEVDVTLEDGLVFTPASDVELDDGEDTTSSTFQAGTFAKTVGSKVYAVAGPLLHFSGVRLPDGWISGTDTGA